VAEQDNDIRVLAGCVHTYRLLSLSRRRSQIALILLPFSRRVGPTVAPPFFASANLASTKADRSILTLFRRSSAGRWSNRRPGLLPQLEVSMTSRHGGYRRGRSCREAPVLKAQSTPFTTARFGPRPSATVGATTWTKHGFKDHPLFVTEIHVQGTTRPRESKYLSRRDEKISSLLRTR
jgi:hypothetical protein